MATQKSVAGRYGPRHDTLDMDDAIAEASAFHDGENFEMEDVEDLSATRQQRLAERHRPRWLSSPRVANIVKWAEGPRPPKKQVVVPLFKNAQQAPRRVLEAYIPSKTNQALALICFYLLWAVTFALILVYWKNWPAKHATDFKRPLQQLGCGDTLWQPRNECGLNGDECRPFTGTFAFRCPPECSKYRLLNPRAVGAQEINYQPLVIGGPVYRGDSFICVAAIHAGLTTENEGGCGVATRIEGHRGFEGSTQNGIESITFNSDFPLSMEFMPESKDSCNGKNLEWLLLAFSVACTTTLSILFTSPAIFFYSAFVGTFVQVALVSDPPSDGTLPLASLFSILTARGLPAIFCAVVLYHTCVRQTLQDLTATLDKTVLWLGGCWCGALSNRTFELIPISRLTPHDIDQQPGAKVALAVIVGVLLLVIIQQIYYFRLEGRLLRYLAIYGLMLVGLLIALSLPGLNLRLHHYIIALLLLPGTTIQTRPSLLYQGILVGLFVNGIARWGFAGFLQTPAALQGDGQFNSLLPTLLEPTISLLSAGSSVGNISLSWVIPEAELGFDGISILVNDAERFRSYFAESTETTFVWPRETTQPEYFRFGYLSGNQGLDYTKAGVWNTDGTWTKMQEGPSR